MSSSSAISGDDVAVPSRGWQVIPPTTRNASPGMHAQAVMHSALRDWLAHHVEDQRGYLPITLRDIRSEPLQITTSGLDAMPPHLTGQADGRTAQNSAAKAGPRHAIQTADNCTGHARGRPAATQRARRSGSAVLQARGRRFDTCRPTYPL